MRFPDRISRQHRAWLAAAIIGLVSLAAALTVRDGARDRSDADLTAHSLSTAAAGPVPESLLACVEQIRIAAGSNLALALAEAGISPAVAHAAITRLGEAIDVRRIRPDDNVFLYRSFTGELDALVYQKTLGERVFAERTGGEYVVRVEREPVQLLVRKLEGEVANSLWFAIDGAGGSPALVGEFADLFSWDFDFASDTRRGDRFRILVEEKRVGGVRTGFGRILTARYLPAGSEHELSAYHHSWGQGDEDGYYDEKGNSIRKFFLKSPLSYRRISSGYSHRRMHPILKTYRPHLGVDYAAPSGTPILALGNGKVVFRGWKGGFGRTVQIRHNGTYLTQYAHLSRYAKGVASGRRVKQGQVIGYVGSSGLSTGPHLDFRVKENGKWINPLRLDGGTPEPLPAAQREPFARRRDQLEELYRALAPGQAVGIDGNEGGDPVVTALLDTSGPS